jgi:hypothetical protein
VIGSQNCRIPRFILQLAALPGLFIIPFILCARARPHEARPRFNPAEGGGLLAVLRRGDKKRPRGFRRSGLLKRDYPFREKSDEP